MIKIVITKKKNLWGQKYHCRIIHTNGNILLWSEKQENLTDLEEMIHNVQKNLANAKIEYDFKIKGE